ncbi:MAG: cation diffusion facilitator family transporter [cyanobacterium endosymbiont of Rhopalodia musculus]|uniref:cation diffusion facilitator family transporter n=1 Tax=cyanobacterium endosymbiont of Epithemia clementina EcSB TaxID=3034674 RepID=UPI00248058A0|nr:cation diffusion facilitator family transporter [cyanobacterium endosymbiont of Epithemia clementina EcSB]WGT67980.1 cation diffusion facilitator family transporter [cyanobacterium endosymbiont of Epithemia clementina EcSB]
MTRHHHINSYDGHSATGHGHHHNPTSYNRAFVVGLLLNTSFVLIEFIGGFIANSVALTADAGHNLSDVLGLILAWAANLVARRQPSSRKIYGCRKSSILAAFLNAVSLLLVTGGIAWEALERLFYPVDVQSNPIIWIAAIGIIINIGTALMFFSGRRNDINIKAVFSHMVADAMVSVGVVLAGIGIILTRWSWLDPAFSLIISVLIIVNSWELLKESFHLVVDGVPTKIDERVVYTYLSEFTGVTQIHDLHIWGISTTETALTAHLVIPQGHPGDKFLSQICQELHNNFGIAHSTLQVELGDSQYTCKLEPTERVSE